jgi:hypothetical protein
VLSLKLSNISNNFFGCVLQMIQHLRSSLSIRQEATAPSPTCQTTLGSIQQFVLIASIVKSTSQQITMNVIMTTFITSINWCASSNKPLVFTVTTSPTFSDEFISSRFVFENIKGNSRSFSSFESSS